MWVGYCSRFNYSDLDAVFYRQFLKACLASDTPYHY